MVKSKKKKCLIDIKVKNNSNFIVKYLKNKVKEKIYTKNMFKCIVYTDNVKTSKYINILRAYRNLILNFSKKYYFLCFLIKK